MGGADGRQGWEGRQTLPAWQWQAGSSTGRSCRQSGGQGGGRPRTPPPLTAQKMFLLYFYYIKYKKSKLHPFCRAFFLDPPDEVAPPGAQDTLAVGFPTVQAILASTRVSWGRANWERESCGSIARHNLSISRAEADDLRLEQNLMASWMT